MKQINKSNAKSLMLAITVGAMTLAQLTACSTADEVTGNNGNETASLKLIIDGALPTDNSKSRSGSLVDNDTHTGGMDFKWLASTDKMTAWAYLPYNGSVLTAFWGQHQSYIESSTLTVTPDASNPKKATLESSSYINYNVPVSSLDGVLYCIQNASNLTSVSNMGKPMKAELIMPENNVFTQTEKNSSAHLTDYLFFKGKGNFKLLNSATADVQDIDVPFNTSVATIRLKVTNKQGAAVTIKSIAIKSAENLFPNLKIWSTMGGCKNIEDLTETIAEPTDKTSYTSSVTAQCGTNGFEVAAGDALYNYVAVHQHDTENTLTDKSLDFVITTADGSTYTAYNFDCNKLSEITGNKDFVAGYTYTFTLSLKNKLTLGGVTVNEWGDEIDGGEADNTAMSLTDLCSTDTYKAQREALTELTLDGSTITTTERDNYMQANFATYFPNVTTLNLTGKSIAQSWIQPKGVNTLLSQAISVPTYCFKDGVTSTIRNVSLPNLKAFSGQILYGISVQNVCFASLTDCSKADQEFTTNNINIAFGATEEFNFGTKTPENIIRYFCGTATLYLNENGYEYQHADLTNNTWRGVTFAAIKKYSEYTGKKD